MSQQTAVETKRVAKTVSVTTVGDMPQRAQEVYDSIARRAFEIFESNGRVFGRDLEDWFRAESELLYPVCLEIAKSETALVVRGALPGFKAKDLEVVVEPRRLTIVGKRETQGGPVREEAVSAKQSPAWILRRVDLPVEVDKGRVTGTLIEGILELTLPVAAATTASKVQSVAA
jgi:HSP20 family protein